MAGEGGRAPQNAPPTHLLGPRVGGVPVGGHRELLDDPRLHPRDVEEGELDAALVVHQPDPVVVGEGGRAARALRRLGGAEPVDVHRDLDRVLLGDEGAPPLEVAEEGADAATLGEVAEERGLERARHLVHVAAQRLVGEQQELGRPVGAASEDLRRQALALALVLRRGLVAEPQAREPAGRPHRARRRRRRGVGPRRQPEHVELHAARRRRRDR